MAVVGWQQTAQTRGLHRRGNQLQQCTGHRPCRAVAAPRCRRVARSRRGGVVVEANLFSRFARVIGSYANQLVSSAEDPEKILDQVVNEMQGDLIRMRQATAQVMAAQKQLENKYKQAQETADSWLQRAELAVQKGEDELGREALKRRKGYQDQANQFKTQLDAQKKAVENLIGNARMLENKLTEAKGKKETLKARAASAKTSKQVQEMVSGLNLGNSMVAFDKMEEKVMSLEAEAESVSVISGGGESSLESKFAALEGGSVEDELSALKRGALRGQSKAPAALPEGRPIKDAIDFELEELRKKARD